MVTCIGLLHFIPDACREHRQHVPAGVGKEPGTAEALTQGVLATLLQLLCSVVVFCQLLVPVCLVNHAAERRLSLRMMELLQQTHASTSSKLPSCQQYSALDKVGEQADDTGSRCAYPRW
jgi:hypothetical protein